MINANYILLSGEGEAAGRPPSCGQAFKNLVSRSPCLQGMCNIIDLDEDSKRKTTQSLSLFVSFIVFGSHLNRRRATWLRSQHSHRIPEDYFVL